MHYYCDCGHYYGFRPDAGSLPPLIRLHLAVSHSGATPVVEVSA